MSAAEWPAAHSKYRNTPVVILDVRFASQGEASRWHELQLLERSFYVKELQRQVPYRLLTLANTGKPGLVGLYVADFTYFEAVHPRVGPWTFIVEDFKGHQTELFRWKRRHFELQYGIPIRITRRGH